MKTIVCPLDSSKVASDGYSYGKSLSCNYDADLNIIHTDALPGFYTENAFIPSAIDLCSRQSKSNQANYYYEEPCQALAAEVATFPQQADSFQSIARIANFALEQKADFIVVGADKRCSIGDVFTSPVSYLHAQAKCPVLVVPEGIVFKPFKRIVVAIDHEVNISPHVDFLTELASRFDAEILFLQVVSASTPKDHPFFDCMMELYFSFPYEKISFYALQHIYLHESIREFAESKQAELIVVLSELSWQADAVPATDYHEGFSSPLTMPVLALNEHPLPTLSILSKGW